MVTCLARLVLACCGLWRATELLLCTKSPPLRFVLRDLAEHQLRLHGTVGNALVTLADSPNLTCLQSTESEISHISQPSPTADMMDVKQGKQTVSALHEA
jgi:hypothetical protein